MRPITQAHRFKGSLVGLATGDALGAWTEDMLPSAIRRHFGGEITTFPQKDNSLLIHEGKFLGTWDTRIALDVARSFIETGSLSKDNIAEKLVNWSLSPLPGKPLPITYMRAARLIRHEPRSKCSSGQPSLSPEGAGRCVPVALFFNGLTQKGVEAAISITELTHSTEAALASSVAITLFISYLLKNVSPLDSFDAVCRTMESSFPDYTNNIIIPVSAYLQLDDEAAFRCIGQRNNLTEIIPSAFYCFLKHNSSFKNAVCCAVNRGGKANSIASVTGALSGAHLGINAIPDEWRQSLHNESAICEIAEQISSAANR